MVPPLTLMCSIEKASDRLAGSGLRGRTGLPLALASQRQVRHRADDDELGDLRLAGPQAGEPHITELVIIRPVANLPLPAAECRTRR